MKTAQVFELNQSVVGNRGDMLRANVRYKGKDIICQMPLDRTMRCDRMVLFELEAGEHGLADGCGVIFGRASMSDFAFEAPPRKKSDLVAVDVPDGASAIDLNTVMHLG